MKNCKGTYRFPPTLVEGQLRWLAVDMWESLPLGPRVAASNGNAVGVVDGVDSVTLYGIPEKIPGIYCS